MSVYLSSKKTFILVKIKYIDSEKIPRSHFKTASM